jgi:Family of unknown function (DUF6502)
MQNNIERQILGAILLVLRPLARALLRAGVGYREFSEIAKTAFVQTATENYGLRGRPTNISRVAVMTGLTRKEVRRIRDKTDASEQTVVVKTTPISEILHRWYTDEQFVDSNGRPKELAFDGDGTTFTTLVRRFGGDVPPGAMRTELKRIDALKFSSDGKMSPTKRVAYNVELRDRLIGGLASIIYPATLNLAHNLEVADESERWANFAATSRSVRPSDKGRIMRISTDRINAFVESIDDMYGAYDTLYDKSESQDKLGAVGVGIFYFEDQSPKSELLS